VDPNATVDATRNKLKISIQPQKVDTKMSAFCITKTEK
jgi:hypothetical protein